MKDRCLPWPGLPLQGAVVPVEGMADGRHLEVLQGPGVSRVLFHSYPLQDETNAPAVHGVPARCHVCTHSL